MIGRRLLLALVWAAALVGPARAQDDDAAPSATRPEKAVVVRGEDGPLAVELVLFPERVDLGTPATLSLQAVVADAPPDGGAAPPPRRIGWPDLSAELPEALGEYAVDVAPHRRSGHLRRLTTEVTFYDAGTFTLPPLTVTLLDGATDSATPTVVLEGATITVTGVLPPEPEAAEADAPKPELPAPKGTRGTVEVPPEALEETEATSWIAAWISAVLVVLALTAWWFLRRLRPRVEAPAPPPPPPHERALAALERLLARHLPESGAVEPYFVELSEILRRYVEDRFGLRAPEQTTEEFLADLQQTAAGRRAIGDAQRAVLRDFLTRADLVKFARDEPDLGTCAQAADAARSFVQETAPRDVAEDDVDAGLDVEDLLA